MLAHQSVSAAGEGTMGKASLLNDCLLHQYRGATTMGWSVYRGDQASHKWWQEGGQQYNTAARES